MKKLLQALLIILLTGTAALSQPRHEAMGRIHEAKLAYISDRLQLSYTQAHAFFPLYSDYEQEIKQTRIFYFRKYRGNMNDTSDGASLQAVDDNLDYQQEVIEIKRKYNERFLRVITPQQLVELYKAEREFKQKLIQRLRQRTGGAGRSFHGNGNGY